jgi:Protein of unknown function (DUF3300)
VRKTLFVPLVVVLASVAPALCQDDSSGGAFSPDQLDNLLAPIALYPDPLLAQVLLAATFPDQIDEAARTVRANSDPDFIDQQPWDVSVKAVGHYPSVISMMADKLDWTTALGQAYVNQSSDVMGAVQRLRAEARSAGNLVTTPQQEVVEDGGYVEIWPAQPQYLYVPVYDPAVVYFGRGGFFAGISFGRPFFIGAWLNNDFDWRGHRVYYHGWDDGRGWIARSRPFIRVSNVYVNVGFRNVIVNRTVINRSVNYGALNRYQSVHRDVNYTNVRVHNNVVNYNRTVNYNERPQVGNKIIERNIDVNDSRIDSYRGHQPPPPPPGRQEQAIRPNVPPPPPARVQVEPRHEPQENAFGGNRGGFNAQAASQRGQESRRAPSNPPAARNDSHDRRR